MKEILLSGSYIPALVVGYTLIVLSIIAGFLYTSWYLINWIIKLTGHWPYFYKTLMEIAYKHNQEKRKRHGE